MKRTFTPLGLKGLALLAALLPLQVAAHAIVVKASPAARSSVAAGAVPVALDFNSRIDHSRSRLALIDARGDATLLSLEQSPEDQMRAVAKAVAPGSYRLEWVVLSVDGHITRGNVVFKVDATGH